MFVGLVLGCLWDVGSTTHADASSMAPPVFIRGCLRSPDYIKEEEGL